MLHLSMDAFASASTPTFMSPADVAAHESASYVRSNRHKVADQGDGPAIPGPRKPSGHAGDSDPDMDEALKRVREHAQALIEGLAAYNEWAQGVPA